MVIMTDLEIIIALKEIANNIDNKVLRIRLEEYIEDFTNLYNFSFTFIE